MSIDHQEIDVLHQGRAHAVCCHRLGDVIVDPGPEVCSERVVEALGGQAPRAILLTHIHFDHAGATGALLERWPQTEVWVHELGASHLADPARLVASATRIYGDDMERLWGRIVPVPEANLRVLRGGETREGFRVAYTPGHAKHHVAYLHEESGLAFTGDVAGVRVRGDLVVPPTPPPDIDLELWAASLDTLAAWRPDALALTHFGTFSDVEHHLALLHEALRRFGESSRRGDAAAFEAEVRAWIAEHAPPEVVEAYLQANPPETLFPGLERYWRTRPPGREGAG